MRRMLFAAGQSAVYQLKRNGRWPPAPNQQLMGKESADINENSPGVTIRRRRNALILIGERWVVSMSVRSGKVRVPSDVGRWSGTSGNGPRAISILIRDSCPGLIRNIRRHGLAITRCCAAAVGPRGRG